MQDAMLHYMRINFATQGLTGKPAQRGGSKVPGVSNAPMGLYPCAPGGPNDYVYIYAQQQMWPAVLQVMGKPELAEDARFKTVEARWENRSALNAIIEGWTRLRSKHEVMRLMGEAGVPCGACQDTGEVLADPHLKAREMVVDIDYPERGTYQTVGCPMKLSDSPAKVTRPPLLGEHTDALLSSLCGMGPEDLRQLRKDGVV
jgi:formyl-CoA transferase